MWQQIRMKAMSSPLPVSLGLLLILLFSSLFLPLLPAPDSLSPLLATSFPQEPGLTHQLEQGPPWIKGLLNLVTVAEHPHLSQASQIPLWSSYHCGPREITHANRERHFNACAMCHFFTRQTCARHFLGTKQLRAHFTRSIHSIPEGKEERQG